MATDARARKRALASLSFMTLVFGLAFGVALAGGLVSAACVGHLPRPEYVEQPTSALTQVGYPPPPARVEFIPKQPSGSGARDPVWIDGEWQWQGRRWAWRLGRWVVPPKGASFAPWMMVRGDDGTVYYAPGAWWSPRHEEVADPAAIAMARPTLSNVVDPEGEMEQTGPSIRTDTKLDAGEADAQPDAEPERESGVAPTSATRTGDAGPG